MEEMYSFHKTVRGYNHVRKEIPCEDASACFTNENGLFHIAVVADGHGDPSCARSAKGSLHAVEVAAKCLKEFAEYFVNAKEKGEDTEFIDQLTYEKGRERLVKQLTDSIIFKWYDEIHRALETEPLTEEELQKAGPYSEVYRSGERLVHLYGTTLIAALWMEDYLIMLQQGDGRCEVFFGDGSVEQPIPWDERCFQNVTTSMCDEDVLISIKHCVLDLKERNVIACYLGSDGIEDSYLDMDGTHTFYRELTCKLNEYGQESFETVLGETLEKLSKTGSGDDMSVAGIVDIKEMEHHIIQFRTQIHKYELSEKLADYKRKLISMERKHGILKRRMNEAQIELENMKQVLTKGYGRDIEAENSFVQTDEETELKEAQEKARRAQEAFEEYHQSYQQIEDAYLVLRTEIQGLEENARVCEKSL